MPHMKQVAGLHRSGMCAGVKEYHRIGAWCALRDCRAMYNEGNARGVAATMKRVKMQRHLARQSPTFDQVLANREAHRVAFEQRQAAWYKRA